MISDASARPSSASSELRRRFQQVALNLWWTWQLNLSILDGWWAEAYDGLNGFAIGSEASHADPEVQWGRDAAALYNVLEREVIPVFFDRDEAGAPRRWIGRMKRSIMTLAWRFSADRMVLDYATTRYLPAVGGTSVR